MDQGAGSTLADNEYDIVAAKYDNGKGMVKWHQFVDNIDKGIDHLFLPLIKELNN